MIAPMDPVSYVINYDSAVAGHRLFAPTRFKRSGPRKDQAP